MSEIRLSSDIYWNRIEEKIMIVINTIMIFIWMAALVIFGLFIGSMNANAAPNKESVKAYKELIRADKEYRTPDFVIEGIRNAKTQQEMEDWLKEDDFLYREFRRPFEFEFRVAVCHDLGKECKSVELELPFK